MIHKFDVNDYRPGDADLLARLLALMAPSDETIAAAQSNPALRRRHNRDLALGLAAAGLWVIPCDAKKVPLAKEFPTKDVDLPAAPDGIDPTYYGATRNPEKIRAWFADGRMAYPGISAGPSGFVVIDADAKLDGPNKLAAWAERNGVDLKQFPCTLTQSGGAHFYLPNVDLQHGCAAGIFRRECGSDVKGNGGFVLSPGAILDAKDEAGKPAIKVYRADPAHPLLSAYDPTLEEAPAAIVAALKSAPQSAKNERSREHELIETLRSDDWPDGADLIDDVDGRYDLSRLAAKDARLCNLLATGGDMTLSENRWHLALALWGEYGDVFTITDFAALIEHLNSEGPTEGRFGTFVGDEAPREGEFSYRSLARDFYRSEAAGRAGHISDGSAFAAVDDEDDDSSSDGVKKIMLHAGQDNSNATKLLNAIDGKIPLYVRGRSLVTVASTSAQARPQLPGADHTPHAHETAAFIPVSPDWLVAKFAKHADCRRMDHTGKIRAASPPHHETKLIVAAPDTWGVPPAFQIAEAPYLLPSGRIVTEQGYDPETLIVLHSSVALQPNLPENPTKENALEALTFVEGLFEEFPFVDEASKSVALSLVLTTLTRNLMDVAPLHAITAPAPGTGKSELAAIATRIAQGRELPAMAAGANEEELAKRIDSAMLAGYPIIALDNVNGVLRGDALCQAVTAPNYQCRRLGKSENVECVNRSTIVATGNNVRLPDDMIRRTLLCSLDAGMERPEQRVFKQSAAELRDRIGKQRAGLIGAGLTIVRAFIQAYLRGEAKPANDFPGFSFWSFYVRSPLIWLGRADPIATQLTVAADDPEAQRRAAIFQAWNELTGGEAARVRDVLDRGSAFTPAPEDAEAEAIERERAEARAVLLEHVPKAPGARGEDAGKHALGNYLRKHKGVIAGGLRLVDGGRDRKGVQTWRTVPA